MSRKKGKRLKKLSRKKAEILKQLSRKRGNIETAELRQKTIESLTKLHKLTQYLGEKKDLVELTNPTHI